MHNTDDLLHWLKNLIVVGREEDNDEGDEGQDEGDNVDDDGEEGEGENSDDDAEEGEDDENDPVKLKAALEAKDKALRQERKLRRAAERDARRNKKAPAKKAEDETKAQEQVAAATAKADKLAKGFRDKAIDDAIKDEARKQGFIDETDAVTDAIRREIDVDQDEDDPTEVDIDFDSVKDAVAELASKKPHLVGKGTPGERSGGKFKKRQKSDDKANQTSLQSNYPSLR